MKEVMTNKFVGIIVTTVIFVAGAFTTAIFDRFLWPGILEKIEIKILGPKRAVLNIAEIVPIQSGMRLENFNLTFATAMGRGWIVAIKKGHDDLRKEFGQVLFPTVLSDQFGMMDYSITIKNTGKRKLSNVRMKIRSKDEIKYINHELFNIDFINCGGFSENQFCDIRINELKKNIKAGLLIGTSLKGIWDVECNVDNSNLICEKNYQNFYVMDVAKVTATGLDFGNKEIIIDSFPDINNQPNLIIYSYSVEKNKWNLIKE